MVTSDFKSRSAETDFDNLLHGIVMEHRPADGVTRVSLSLANRELEIPLSTAPVGESVGVAIRAGDILIASEPPRGLGIQNVLQGTLINLKVRGLICVALVDAGMPLTVQLTPSEARSLRLEKGQPVWLIVKTYSCRLIASMS